MDLLLPHLSWEPASIELTSFLLHVFSLFRSWL
jgi:hypothetical protein